MTKTLLCRTATTFAPDGSLDEGAFRDFLQRFVDSGLGVYLGSGGSGEGHALTFEELGRVYRAGVATCGGKVRVYSNQPEQNTARDTIAHAQLAAECGIEVINIYGPEGRHGYRANDEEYLAYFDLVLKEITHPVALAPNPTVGYSPPAHVIAQIAARYPQVTTINLAGLGDAYYADLRQSLDRDVEIFVPYIASIHMLDAGATGLLGAEANVIPKTFRRYLDLYEADDRVAMADVYLSLRRTTTYFNHWKSTSPRWIKMAMRAFKLPGGEGGPREPYLMPDDAEIERFVRGALELGVPELNELAVAAGLA